MPGLSRSCLRFIFSFAICIIAASAISTSSLGHETLRLDRGKVEGGELRLDGQWPAGLARVTVESKRLEGGAWLPRVLVRPSTSGLSSGQFEIPLLEEGEVFRLRGELEQPLPASWYAGPPVKTFIDGKPGSSRIVGRPGDPDLLFMTMSRLGSLSELKYGKYQAEPYITAQRHMFLNQDKLLITSQGKLQVWSINESDQLTRQRALAIPGPVVTAHWFGSRYVAAICATELFFLARTNSVLCVFDLQSRSPVPIAQVPIAGQFRETRRIGDALYVLARQARFNPNEDIPIQNRWEWATIVTTVDLSDPAQPQIGAIGWLDEMDLPMQQSRLAAVGSGGEEVLIDDRRLLLDRTSLSLFRLESGTNSNLLSQADVHWSVDRVLLRTPFVVQITDGKKPLADGPIEAPAIRVTSVNDPDRVLQRIGLAPGWEIVGATLRDRFLFTIQMEEGSKSPDARFRVSTWAVDSLPAVQLVAEVEFVGPRVIPGFGFEALWPKKNVLVWAQYGRSLREFDVPPYGVLFPDGRVEFMVGLIPPMPPEHLWSRKHSVHSLVTNSNGSLSEVQSVVLSHETWNVSRPIASNGLVYWSYQIEEEGNLETNHVSQSWQSFQLAVIDYSDPAVPTARPPVRIAGSLHGVFRQGELLICVGPADPTLSDSSLKEMVSAHAYDGIHAYPFAALPAAPASIQLKDETIFRVGPKTRKLEQWTLKGSRGGFSKIAELEIASERIEVVGDLLVVSSKPWEIYRFEGGKLELVGKFSYPGDPGFPLSKAVGGSDSGIWLPLGLKGAWHARVQAQ